MLYCPICKAEYREGFKRCSDCLADLVGTQEAAANIKTVLLWKGSSQSKFNDIVGALRDAGIANYSRSGVQAERKRSIWFYVPIVSYFVKAAEIRDQMSWQVFVQESDSLKAHEIVGG